MMSDGTILYLLKVPKMEALTLQIEQEGNEGNALWQSQALSRKARIKLNREMLTIF